MNFVCSVILHAFMYDPGQMTIRTMLPRYYTILRWSPQKHKDDVLLYYLPCIPYIKVC